jgi:hypothetical protein
MAAYRTRGQLLAQKDGVEGDLRRQLAEHL